MLTSTKTSSNEPVPKRTYTKCFGLSYRALTNRKEILRKLVSMFHFSGVAHVLDTESLQCFLTAFNHFETHNRLIRYYVNSNHTLDNFAPPSVVHYRCLSIQPQLVKNNIHLVVSVPHPLATKKKEKFSQFLLCSLCQDPEVLTELESRVLAVDEGALFEHLCFSEIPLADHSQKPISSLIFSLYLELMLLQTKLPCKLLRPHLASTSLHLMKAHVIQALQVVTHATAFTTKSSPSNQKKKKTSP